MMHNAGIGLAGAVNVLQELMIRLEHKWSAIQVHVEFLAYF